LASPLPLPSLVALREEDARHMTRLRFFFSFSTNYLSGQGLVPALPLSPPSVGFRSPQSHSASARQLFFERLLSDCSTPLFPYFPTGFFISKDLNIRLDPEFYLLFSPPLGSPHGKITRRDMLLRMDCHSPLPLLPLHVKSPGNRMIVAMQTVERLAIGLPFFSFSFLAYLSQWPRDGHPLATRGAAPPSTFPVCGSPA